MGRILKAEVNENSPFTKAVSNAFEQRASGKTVKQTAEILHKSHKTIESHTSYLLAEMECENTIEAIGKAVAEGWLTFKYIKQTSNVLLVIMALNMVASVGVENRSAIKTRMRVSTYQRVTTSQRIAA